METQIIAISRDDDLYIPLLVLVSEDLENNQTLLSDEKFAEELQLQEAIISSLINLQTSGSDSESGKASKEVGESSKMAANEAAGESSKMAADRVGGESSQSLCEICVEKKHSDDMFPLQNCSHSFCRDCISKHISIKIKKRAIVNEAKGSITCPGLDCTSTLEIDSCREIVPRDVVSMWDEVICESMISPSEKFYCPYKDCSALLVKESSEEVIREAECPFCRRLFCVRCNVPWHGEVDCEEFSRLSEEEKGREDLMVRDLAKKNKWQRCPHCKFFVEKNQGCLHMTCRCGFEFCYACGKTWSSTHGGCQ